MSKPALIFERQWLHALALAGLLAAMAALSGVESVRAGRLLGLDTPVWLWTAVAFPVAHQVLVWFCWRMELHTAWLSRTFGRRGFELYVVAFSIIGIARVVVVFLLAASNRNTFDAVDPLALRIVGTIYMVPAVYVFYSVRRYFGFRRAFGIDHFDPSYRSQPLEQRGAFRFTSNGMYLFGFAVIWLPGLWYASSAALAVALFNHIYIWVHYLATERPDMRRIYGEASS
jgi:protein-S-isoprenylcysteine O-methyltransferase Ste14